MGGKSSKKQAQSNLLALRNLYLTTVPVVLLACARQCISRKDLVSWIRFILLHVPLLGCIYVLDSSGRPKYDVKRQLVREGLDLSQSGGLTEYMFDIIYLSLFGDLGQVVLNTKKFWYSLILVPTYVIWKVYGLMPSLPVSGKTRSAKDQSTKPAQSKRQAKLARRQDKAQVKYR